MLNSHYLVLRCAACLGAAHSRRRFSLNGECISLNPLCSISKQLLQWTENDAICIRVRLPPTLSTEHNLLFMLIVCTCDYEVEHCVCVCVSVHLCPRLLALNSL